MPQNPLLKLKDNLHYAPDFKTIEAEHFVPALEYGIDIAKNNIHQIKINTDEPSFDNTIEALEKADEIVSDVASILGTLYNVRMTEDMEEAKRHAQVMMNDFSQSVLTDHALFLRVKTVYDQRDTLDLDEEKKILLEESYKGFVRNGAQVSDEDKETLKSIKQELIQKQTSFHQNVTKSINEYKHFITDESELEGMSAHIIATTQQLAKAEGRADDYCMTLQPGVYHDVMTYAHNRSLRETLWRAQQKLCSEGDKNNFTLIKDILKLRNQSVKLLGYENFPQYQLEQRILDTPDKVCDFLGVIRERTRDHYVRDRQTLVDFAQQKDGLSELKPWDIGYYKNLHKAERYDYNPQEVQNYFPLSSVLTGFFEHCERLFSIDFVQTNEVPSYHADVEVYEVHDKQDGRLLGLMYVDLFYREQKYAHAWMSKIYSHHYRADGTRQIPLCTINMSLVKGADAAHPTLLNLNHVETLFHEGGHALHCLLSQTPHYSSLSGTNVKWDFVELPSQIQENWVMEEDVLTGFSKHFETGDTLPKELFDKIDADSQHMQGLFYYRQNFLGTLDYRWHTEISGEEDMDHIQAFENEVAQTFYPDEDREGASMSQQFSHIFAGGYACGYYSYAYCEMLDADAFEAFKETGDLYHPETATKLRELMNLGGTREPLDIYQDFRGRAPDTEAMFKRAGLIDKKAA